jgi:hypothetical protein
MKIYISIPISGKDLMTQTGKALEIAEKIKALGHEPVNPFDTPLAPLEMSYKESYAYYMGEDIKRLLMCDAAYFHPEWTKSKGCSTEHDIAVRYGLERFYTFSDMMPIDEIIPKTK